jgi:hypothetical protein
VEPHIHMFYGLPQETIRLCRVLLFVRPMGYVCGGLGDALPRTYRQRRGATAVRFRSLPACHRLRWTVRNLLSQEKPTGSSSNARATEEGRLGTTCQQLLYGVRLRAEATGRHSMSPPRMLPNLRHGAGMLVAPPRCSQLSASETRNEATAQERRHRRGLQPERKKTLPGRRGPRIVRRRAWIETKAFLVAVTILGWQPEGKVQRSCTRGLQSDGRRRVARVHLGNFLEPNYEQQRGKCRSTTDRTFPNAARLTLDYCM